MSRQELLLHGWLYTNLNGYKGSLFAWSRDAPETSFLESRQSTKWKIQHIFKIIVHSEVYCIKPPQPEIIVGHSSHNPHWPPYHASLMWIHVGSVHTPSLENSEDRVLWVYFPSNLNPGLCWRVCLPLWRRVNDWGDLIRWHQEGRLPFSPIAYATAISVWRGNKGLGLYARGPK